MEENISEINKSVEDIMNNSEEIDDQMSDIVDDINHSIYKYIGLNETELIIKDTEIVEVTSQTQKRSTRENTGKWISCLEPKFTGESYNSIKKKVQFLMNKSKNEVKDKKTYDVEASMKSAVNVMFTQIQATRGFNLFGEHAVDVMIKELKRLE